MITLDKLKIYRRFKGDLDAYGRSESPSERELLNDREWYLIDRLLEDATVISRSLGSKARTESAKKRLQQHCEDESVVLEIYRLADLM